MVDSTLNYFGRLDILFCAAGVSEIVEIAECDDQAYHRQIDVNLNGVFYCIRAAIPRMADQGRIIVMSSDEGRQGSVFVGPYAATKHAVLGLIKSVAKEVGKRGITANAICPGWVDTDMGRTDQEKRAKKLGVTVQELRPSVLAADPQHRISTAQDIANLALFLASEDSQAISGQGIGIGTVTC